MGQRVHIHLEDDLLERVDAARGDVSRSRFVMRALEAALDNPDGHGARVARVAAPEGTRPPEVLGDSRGQSDGDSKPPVSAPPRAHVQFVKPFKPIPKGGKK